MKDKYAKYIHEGIVCLPYGLTTIEEDAFLDCQEITKVIIPNTVRTIERSAFSCCYSLTEIEIPNSVTSIGEAVFSYSGLTRIDLPESIYQIGKWAFAGIDIVDIFIPSRVKRIEESTFDHCKQLRCIELPDGLEDIGDYAFLGCESLVSIMIPDSVHSIGRMAFSGCESLNQLHIPSHLSIVGEMAFSMCSGVNTVSNSSLFYRAINNCLLSRDELIFGCKNSIIPEDANIKVIKKQAFFWQDIQNLTIPNGVEKIEDQAFSCCKKLTRIELPISLNTIEGNPFSYCNRLSSIKAEYDFLYSSFVARDNCLLDASETILYVGCNNSIIPQTVKTIHHIAFQGSGVKTVTIPRGVESLGNYVFKDCKSLTQVRIPSTIIDWGCCVFSGCYNLRIIELFVDNPSFIRDRQKSSFVDGLDLSQITLVVPIGSGYEYRNDPVFGGCKEILPQLRKEDPIPPLLSELPF